MQFLDGSPTLTNNPVISFTHEVADETRCANKYLVIQCDVTHDEPDIFLDVYWYIGNRLVKQNVEEDALRYADFPAVLREVEWVTDRSAPSPLDTEVLSN